MKKLFIIAAMAATVLSSCSKSCDEEKNALESKYRGSITNAEVNGQDEHAAELNRQYFYDLNQLNDRCE